MSAGDTIAFALFDAAGVPLTTATPTFTVYANRGGTARSQPAITHVGGGVYRFQPSTTDVLEGIAYAVDAGAGAFPARLAGGICPESAPFAVLLLTDAAGALWTGAAPSVGVYRDPSGVARTAPALVAAAGAYLYSFTPSSSDLATGVEFRLDAPANAFPSYASGSFAVAATVDPAQSSQGEPQGLFRQVITYAAVASRDQWGKPTMAAPATSRARVQPVNIFVRDAAGESILAKFKIYVPPAVGVTLQHRIWLAGDDTSSAIAARRILKIDDPVDGVGVSRFRTLWL